MITIFTFNPPDHLKNDLITCFPDVHFSFYPDIYHAEQSIPNAEVIVTYGEDLTDVHIQICKQLKWIMVTSAGLERMPLQAIKDKKILVTNARGIHKIPMAEFTIGFILQHAKQFSFMKKQQNDQIWSKSLLSTEEIAHQTIMIVGAGSIGSEIARLAKAFGMKVIGVNKSGKTLEYFDEMYLLNSMERGLETADFVVNILPSTPETKSFYQKQHFEMMKKSAAFINIGRGDVVEEKVLLTVLNENLINHAFLDVFEQEPLPKGHPFWSMENVTITPHISSNTNNYLPRSFEILKHNFYTYTNKQTNFLNVINLERGY
jgi:phosphoglycerate dehydrogenase-like enzyme